MGCLLCLVLVVACFYIYMMVALPSVSVLRDMRMQTPLYVYTADHQLIASFGEKRRIPIALKEAPPLLIKGILDTEDKRFFEHPGVDVLGLVRASIKLIATGRKSQGASTITMQVARNFFLSSKKTFTRKINEILLAIKISQAFSKEKVLTLYLNKIYLGHRAYGVAAAAQVYYGKSLDDLSLPQLAMLAGLPQAPSRENPITNPAKAMKRRNHVLERMLEAGDINQAQYAAAIEAPVTASYHELDVAVKAPYVAEMVRDELVQQYGERAYTGGFNVVTTIDSEMQKAANRAVENGLLAYDRRHGYRGPEMHWTVAMDAPDANATIAKHLEDLPVMGDLLPAMVVSVEDQEATVMLPNRERVTLPWSGIQWARMNHNGVLGPVPENAADVLSVGDVVRVENKGSTWRLSQVPEAQAALVAIDDRNGAIRAMVGGFSFNQSHYNRAIQAKRQPGSSFKPFIYASALAKGYTLASTFDDAPVVVPDVGENPWWRPQNVEERFYGPTRLRVGLVKSRNLLTVRLLQAVGLPFTIDYCARFGFDQDAMPNSLSMALGSGVLSPLVLTRAYAIIANGGYAVDTHVMQSLHDNSGHVLALPARPVVCEHCEADQKPAQRVISPEISYLINSALESVISEGTGRGAKVLHRSDLAGKTGTTNDQVDAWFAGYAGDVVTTVWVGFDQPHSLGEYGSGVALPIWVDFMRVALKQRPIKHLPRPSDIISVRIDPKTGALAQSGRSSLFELFRRDYVPKASAFVSTSDDDNTQAADDTPIF